MPADWKSISALAILSAAAVTFCVQAQQVGRVEASSFKVQLETYPPPHETQIKTLLQGKKADPQPGGVVIFTEPRIDRFTTNGLLELQVRSPECTFDIMKRTVSSTNMIQVEMTGGRFFTEARGYLRMTNGTILLSNDVRTVIRTDGRTFKKP
jgi:hypothetical protein